MSEKCTLEKRITAISGPSPVCSLLAWEHSLQKRGTPLQGGGLLFLHTAPRGEAYRSEYCPRRTFSAWLHINPAIEP